MRNIFILFVVAWLLCAVFDFSFDNQIFRAYTASEPADYDPNEARPRLVPRSIIEYRVQENSVVSRIGDYVNEYDDCIIFDRDNWSCTYSDESGEFGARQGEYFNRSNLESFPHLKDLDGYVTLSRFRYILLLCRWDFSGVLDSFSCVFRPFVT